MMRFSKMNPLTFFFFKALHVEFQKCPDIYHTSARFRAWRFHYCCNIYDLLFMCSRVVLDHPFISELTDLICPGFRPIASAEACNDLMAYSLVLSCCCYTCCVRRKLRQMLNITVCSSFQRFPLPLTFIGRRSHGLLVPSAPRHRRGGFSTTSSLT